VIAVVRQRVFDVYRVALAIDLHVADLEPESRPAPVRLDHFVFVNANYE
jgi:hypothetical protein